MSETQVTSATKRKPRSRVKATASGDNAAANDNNGSSEQVVQDTTDVAQSNGADVTVDRGAAPEGADDAILSSAKTKTKSKKSRSKKAAKEPVSRETTSASAPTDEPPAHPRSSVLGSLSMLG